MKRPSSSFSRHCHSSFIERKTCLDLEQQQGQFLSFIFSTITNIQESHGMPLAKQKSFASLRWRLGERRGSARRNSAAETSIDRAPVLPTACSHPGHQSLLRRLRDPLHAMHSAHNRNSNKSRSGAKHSQCLSGLRRAGHVPDPQAFSSGTTSGRGIARPPIHEHGSRLKDNRINRGCH